MMNDIERSPANRTLREFIEFEAAQHDPLDREFAVKRMCGPRAVKGSPLPLPELTDEQIVRYAKWFYRHLLDLQEALAGDDKGTWRLTTVNAWLGARAAIKRAANTKPEEASDAVA